MFPFDVKSKGRGRVDTSRDVFIEDEHKVEENFSGLPKHVSFVSVGSTFERCDFRRMRSRDVSFGAGKKLSRYVQCKFDGSRLVNPDVGLARFEGCSFL